MEARGATGATGGDTVGDGAVGLVASTEFSGLAGLTGVDSSVGGSSGEVDGPGAIAGAGWAGRVTTRMGAGGGCADFCQTKLPQPRKPRWNSSVAIALLNQTAFGVCGRSNFSTYPFRTEDDFSIALPFEYGLLVACQLSSRRPV